MPLYYFNAGVSQEERTEKKQKLLVKYVSLPIKISYIDFDYHLFMAFHVAFACIKKQGFIKSVKFFGSDFLVSFQRVCYCGFY